MTTRLEELAEEQEHPWGLATAKRCRALVQFASGGFAEGAGLMAEAVDAYQRLGLRFDCARSLLCLGRAARRVRKWGAARGSLDEAATAFEAMGAPGWAEQAGTELARVGARRPAREGELTPAERRAASLAARGLSNKEIARAMFVSVHTVERHLSRAFTKLGVRSRSQLAALPHQRRTPVKE